jgi:hypothetical protein
MRTKFKDVSAYSFDYQKIVYHNVKFIILNMGTRPVVALM